MIPLMKSTFLKEHETKTELAKFIMQAEKLSMGDQCVLFEKEFALYQGRKEAILFNSGASANLVMIQTLKNLGNLKEGDLVGFSALTWSTNVMPLIQLGLQPVPIDSKIEVLNVTSEQLLKRLRDTNLKALFITNALGLVGDLDKIRDICNNEKIILLEDNCEALGTELLTGKAGNFGLMASFSFFVAHHMSTIEGGMVCTDDPDFAEMLRIVRANGWDRNLTADQQHKWRKKYGVTSEFHAKYTFYDLGFNFRPTEITGFLGRYQLQLLNENIKIRERNYIDLETVVMKNPDLVALSRDHISVLSSFAFPVVCRSPELKELYVRQFAGAGVEIRPMIAGNIQEQPFFRKYISDRYDLPSTDFIDKCSFYCGNYPDLTTSDIEILKSCLSKY
jgi:CDP-4-dehydro-6-deoxyglucose reductase, E1